MYAMIERLEVNINMQENVFGNLCSFFKRFVVSKRKTKFRKKKEKFSTNTDFVF